MAASQASHSLGFHTRVKSIDPSSGGPNKFGLLFWVIYYFEKTLSLRLGRCSTISDCEVTAPFPGDSFPPSFSSSSSSSSSSAPASVPSPFMLYCRHMVRLARLAGNIHEKLYSAHALGLSSETRRQRVEELSEELRGIKEDTRSVMVST